MRRSLRNPCRFLTKCLTVVSDRLGRSVGLSSGNLRHLAFSRYFPGDDGFQDELFFEEYEIGSLALWRLEGDETFVAGPRRGIHHLQRGLLDFSVLAEPFGVRVPALGQPQGKAV